MVVITINHMELWSGYIIEINRYDGKLVMLTDGKHLVLCIETAYNVIEGKRNVNDRQEAEITWIWFVLFRNCPT